MDNYTLTFCQKKTMIVLLLVVEIAAHRNEKLCKKEKGRSTQLDWKIKTF